MTQSIHNCKVSGPSTTVGTSEKCPWLMSYHQLYSLLRLCVSCSDFLPPQSRQDQWQMILEFPLLGPRRYQPFSGLAATLLHLLYHSSGEGGHLGWLGSFRVSTNLKFISYWETRLVVNLHITDSFTAGVCQTEEWGQEGHSASWVISSPGCGGPPCTAGNVGKGFFLVSVPFQKMIWTLELFSSLFRTEPNSCHLVTFNCSCTQKGLQMLSAGKYSGLKRLLS